MNRGTIVGALALALGIGCGPKQVAHPVGGGTATSGDDGDDDDATEQPTAVEGGSDPGSDTTAPAPAPASSLSADAQALLDAHNADRAKHCAPALTWSDRLAEVAQKWADHLRDEGCGFEHSDTEYGENLAAGTTGAMPPEAVVKMWYDEKSKFDFKRGGFSMDTGHFTQLVWVGTTQVGCGMSQCNGFDVWVCNYAPAGNVDGEYRTNVLPTSCAR